MAKRSDTTAGDFAKPLDDHPPSGVRERAKHHVQGIARHMPNDLHARWRVKCRWKAIGLRGSCRTWGPTFTRLLGMHRQWPTRLLHAAIRRTQQADAEGDGRSFQSPMWSLPPRRITTAEITTKIAA